ncbi:hypothetical protein JCM3774_003397 [Rhodotorula dairenensis]
MASLDSSTLASPHLDLVSAVAFNPLGSHLATASLDHHVRVAHPSPTSPGTWDYCPRMWKAHDGAVLSLSWADPEFGTVFATGGVDGVVKIWRQDEPPPRPGQCSPESGGGTPVHKSSMAGSGWALAASLTDCRGTVRGLSFAPSHFGLKLAAIASDSHLRVWDCLDATAALREWTLVEDVDLAGLGLAPSTGSGGGNSGAHAYAGSSAVSGGAGGYDTGGLETGSSYGGGGGGASGSGPSNNTAFPTASSIASSANHGSSAAGSSVGYGGGNTRAGGTVESDGGWAVSWCPEHWWGERLAVSSGSNGVIRLFHFSPSRPWNNYLNLVPSRLAQSQGLSTYQYAPSASGFHHSSDEASHSAFSTSSAGSSTDPASRDGHYGSGNSTHTPPVSSLSFAPPSGRSYLLLAAGARDGRARVWRIAPPPLSLPRSASSVQNGTAGTGGGSGGGDHEGEDGLSESDGDWTARLEVELEPATGGESHAATGGHHLGGAGNPTMPNNSSRRGAGLGGAMSAVKVEWNILGTVLSTSGGEDGRVRVWKPTYTGQWRQVAVLGTQDSVAPGAGHV